MKSSKSKIGIIIIIIVFSILSLVGFILLKRGGTKSENETGEQKKIAEPVNQIPIEERPFNYIYPRADGREVTIVINKLDGYQAAEYELEYQAGTLLQGAFGQVDFVKEQAPIERNILLGSCSAGGKCSYHENVNGGTLTVRYLDGEVTKLKSEWNFQLMRDQEGKFSSRDAKFSFDVGNNGLSPSTYVVICQTMGLPGEVDGKIIGGPYAVTLPKSINLRTNEVELSIRLNEDNSDAKLLGWTKDGWMEYEYESDGKNLIATVDSATTYVVIAPDDMSTQTE